MTALKISYIPFVKETFDYFVLVFPKLTGKDINQRKETTC